MTNQSWIHKDGYGITPLESWMCGMDASAPSQKLDDPRKLDDRGLRLLESWMRQEASFSDGKSWV